MMKKKIFAGISILAALAGSLFIGTGFTKNPNVVIVDYSVSEDGQELIFTTGVPQSIGYVRGFNDIGGGVKPHYLEFYSTFGIINSAWGAENQHVLALDDNDTEIYFNRADGGYELVLQKDAGTGTWVRPVE